MHANRRRVGEKKRGKGEKVTNDDNQGPSNANVREVVYIWRTTNEDNSRNFLYAYQMY